MPRKVWDTADVLLQQLYGLSGFHLGTATPRFGSSLMMDLTVGSFGTVHRLESDDEGHLSINREGATETLPPTLYNLAWHFGYMDWAVQNMLNLLRQSKGRVSASDLDSRFFIAAQAYATDHFEKRRILPLRKELQQCQQPLHFYCVPATVVETDLKSGKTLVHEGAFVLSVLPKSVKVARHYRIAEADIQLLAPQVVWLIRMFCSHGNIRSAEQLAEYANGWTGYLSRSTMEQLIETIREVNPKLISPESTRALLPGK